MSLFHKRSVDFLDAGQLVGQRTQSRHAPNVTTETSLRHSAVWACRRLRADLVSTMPVDVFRTIDGTDVEQTKPVIFVSPGGEKVDWCEWAYSTQDDLDAGGNTLGIITARDGNRIPSRIDLVPWNEVNLKGRGSVIEEYRVGASTYTPDEVWHERQFTRSGMPVGLSPIAYAAMSIGGYLSAQEFARDWFSGGGIPAAHLKNVAKVLQPGESDTIKQRFRATTGTGDLFVTGSDWTFDTIAAKASESEFIEQMQFSITDLCRFMGVPADMIDAETSTGSITYANVTQRNLQLLIMNLNPALRRREVAFSRGLLSNPRFVKFNRGSLLEMDLKTRYEAHGVALDKRFMVPSEVRALENRAPFTDAQLAEFAIYSKAPSPAPAPMGVPQ